MKAKRFSVNHEIGGGKKDSQTVKMPSLSGKNSGKSPLHF
jgi:hypothetical protein